MKEFKATDYLKSDRVTILQAIINWWEDWRCALESECIYDLNIKEDLIYFIEKYGVLKAVKCYDEYPLWMDGLNFKEPARMDKDKMLNIINCEYDIELFKDMLDSGYEDDLNKWFDVDKIKNIIKEETFVPYTFSCSFKSDKGFFNVEKLFVEFMKKNFTDYITQLSVDV